MLATKKSIFNFSIVFEIESHSAWHEGISGLNAEKKLRNIKVPYVFILRKGEDSTNEEINYYVSFVQPDLTIKHQPFTIKIQEEGWYYENGMAGGPFVDASIDDVLYKIMHCEREDCIPYLQ